MACVPISEDVQLSRISHYVAGVPIPPQPDLEDELIFETYYAKLGVATLPTICHGDWGLDSMNMMMAVPQSFETRNALRVEIS